MRNRASPVCILAAWHPSSRQTLDVCDERCGISLPDALVGTAITLNIIVKMDRPSLTVTLVIGLDDRPGLT